MQLEVEVVRALERCVEKRRDLRDVQREEWRLGSSCCFFLKQDQHMLFSSVSSPDVT